MKPWSALSSMLLILVASLSVAMDEANDRTLVIYCWPGYVPDTVVDAFTKATGIEVVLERFNSNEELLRHRLVEGRFDLVQPSDYALEALIERGALQPLNKERIPNLKNVDPSFLSLPQDPDGEYSVPWMAGTVGIVVNTDRVKEPIRGYGDVFSGKYSGRIVALNDARQWLSWTLFHLGKPINDVNDDVLAAVQPVWENWIPQIAVFDSDNAVRVMLSGQADIAITWSGDAARLLAKSPSYQYVLPREGAPRYVDCLAIPRGAADHEAAEEFMNFILRPDISVMISEAIPFTNPNQQAFQKLPKAMQTNPASYPPADARLKSFRSIGEMVDRVEKLYNSIRFRPAGISRLKVLDEPSLQRSSPSTGRGDRSSFWK